MFSDPFSTELECLSAIANFLLKNRDETYSLWTESLEKIVPERYVFSLWASGDITLSLVELADHLMHSCDGSEALGEVEGVLLGEIKHAVAKTVTALFEIDVTHIQKYKRTQSSRDCRSLLRETNIWEIHNTLAELVREAMGYFGFPRSYSPPSQAAMMGSWGAANIIASCAVYTIIARARDLEIVDDSKMINDWLSGYCDHLSRPELGVLRQALHQLDSKYGVEQSKKVDLSLYWNDLHTTYENCMYPEVVSPLLGFQPFPRPNENDIDIRDTLSKLITTHFPRGSFLIDPRGFGGWTSVPFQTGAGIDPVATLSALEVLASISSKTQLDKTTQDSLLGAIQMSLLFLENDVRNTLDGADNWLDKARACPNLSERWQLGLLCRSVMAYVRIFQCLSSSTCAVKELNGELAEQALEVVNKLKETMYTALLVKVFKLEVEVRSPPYEAVPVALVSGNELSHWPGLDTGYVALALIRGWGDYKWEEATKHYAELISLKDRIRPVDWEKDGTLPLPPVLHATINMVKQQIVGPHNEVIVREHLIKKGLPSDGKPIKGAFLANISVVPGREYNPTIYLWATAHALSALVEWRRLGDQKHRDVESIRTNFAHLTQKTKIESARLRIVALASNGMPKWFGYGVVGICMFSYAVFLSINYSSTCFDQKLLSGQPELRHIIFSFIFLPLPCFWFTWLGIVVTSRFNHLLSEGLTGAVSVKSMDNKVKIWRTIIVGMWPFLCSIAIMILGVGSRDFVWFIDLINSYPNLIYTFIVIFILIVFPWDETKIGKGVISYIFQFENLVGIVNDIRRSWKICWKLSGILPNQGKDWIDIETNIKEMDE